MYTNSNDEDMKTIIKAFIMYYIRLNVVLEDFKKDIP